MLNNTAEKDGRVAENMKSYKGLEMFLSEIPNPNAPNLNVSHRHHHQLANGSPISTDFLRSEYTPSSSFSNGFCSSLDGVPCPISFEEVKHRTHSTHRSSINGKPVDNTGLSETFRRMHVGDGQGDGTNTMGFKVDNDGFGFGGPYLGGTVSQNVVNYGEYEGFSNGASGFEGFQSSQLGAPMSFYEDRESDLIGSYIAHNQSNALYSGPSGNTNQTNASLDERNERGNGCTYGGIQRQNPAAVRPYLGDASISSPRCAIDSNGDKGVMEPFTSPRPLHSSTLALNVDDSFSSRLMMNERTRKVPNSMVPESLTSIRGASDVGVFTCQDNFIIQGESLNYGVINNSKALRNSFTNEMAAQNQRGKSSEWDNYSRFGRVCGSGRSPSGDCTLFLQPPFNSLAEVQEYIYFLAKNQYGCRFLQGVFDKGTCQDVQIIFSEIVGHAVELMTDPFGNYLVQKLLDVCNEEQRTQIVLMVTNQPGQLIRISRNAHG